MIDLQKLKDGLSEEKVIELVTSLGADSYVEKSDCIIFPTICHNIDPSEASQKLYYYKKNKQFHCYTDCGCNFNIYNLYARRYELLGIEYDFFKDIILKVADGHSFSDLESFTNPYESDYQKYKREEPTIEIKPLNKSLLNIYSKFYTPEWLDEGITREAMDTFHIRYSIPQNKIVIPHYDKDGDLIGIRGRALNSEDVATAKYMPIIEGDTVYAHPLGYNLYGIDLNKDNIARAKTAIVFESEKSVLKYESIYGRLKNISVAVCGSNFSAYQLNLLLHAGAQRIIIAFDKEGVTWEEQCKYREKLNRICKRYSNKCIIGYIWDTKNLLGNKDSPIDKGKDTFEKLCREGVEWIK